MRKYAFLVVFLGLLLVGGFVTALGSDGGLGGMLPFLRQSGDPSASTDSIEPWQAEQLFLLVGFIVINIVGIGATLAGLLWALNRGVKVSQAEEEAASE